MREMALLASGSTVSSMLWELGFVGRTLEQAWPWISVGILAGAAVAVLALIIRDAHPQRCPRR